MKLREAIALSTCNKARAVRHEDTFVVQQRYATREDTWYHVWHLQERGEDECDTGKNLSELHKHSVDPDADIWQPV